MSTFLHKIAQLIKENAGDSTANILVILPSRRASLFLQKELIQVYGKTIICPDIISTEDLIMELTGFTLVDPLELSIELYRSYQFVYKEKAEPFEQFLKWSSMLIQDYNEIDRYLIDSKQIFQNLRDIKEIEEWSLAEEPLSPMQINYLEFMGKLQDIYLNFHERLSQKKIAYQGFAYRIGTEKVIGNPYLSGYKKIFICGFNALNAAEEKIFSQLVSHHGAELIWDADEYYLNDPQQEAGQFIRNHQQKELLKGQLILGNELSTENKKFKIFAAPKNFSQAIVCNKILNEILSHSNNLNRTVIVLADENILSPILSTLPKEVKEVNVTLEYPMKQTVLYDFFMNLLQLHLNRINKNKGEIFYYKDLEKVIQNPYCQLLFQSYRPLEELRTWMKKSNKEFVSIGKIDRFLSVEKESCQILFHTWNTCEEILSNFLLILSSLENYMISNPKNPLHLESEVIFQSRKIFNRIEEFIHQSDLFSQPETFKQLFQQLLSQVSAPFYGEPLTGLQIMGVLETRVLDFETVILTSVNENVLPSGKSQNSFLPNDLKRYFKLPTYSDKDAIYAYHFFRMIQRAKNVYLIYNTETERSGSAEKSRFVTQLLLELREKNKSAHFEEHFFTSGASDKKDLKIEYQSDDYIKKKLVEKGTSGYSVSLINSFKECALKFYLQQIIGVETDSELEENVESSTMGKIIHCALELSYFPFLKKILNPSDYREMRSKINKNVRTAFKTYYSEDEISEGKNLLAMETVIQYVERVIDSDEEFLKKEIEQGSTFSVIEIEKTLFANIDIQKGEETISVVIKGTCDRIEKTKSHLRIVDYKSSVNKSKDKFKIENLESLFDNNAFNKALQLYLYAWLAWKNNLARSEEIETLIYTFKGSEMPYFKLSREDESAVYSDDFFKEFESQLSRFISKLVTEDLLFTQTSNLEICQYCDFNRFCNRSHLN